MNLILFFKAEQFDLFAAPVNVKAATRKGKTVKPYTRIQHVAPVDYSASAGKYGHFTHELTAAAMRVSVKPNGYPHVEEQGTNGEWRPNAAIRHIKPAHAALRAAGIKAAPSAFDMRSGVGISEPDDEAEAAAIVEKHRAADAAAMQRYATGVRAQEARIVGHSWEDIQRAQRGGTLNKPIDTSKPIDHSLSEADKALIEKHGVQGLAAMGFHGVLDRYHRSQAAAKPETALPTPEGARVHNGAFYFATHERAERYAREKGYPTDRIILYDRGHAIQGGESGDYAGPHGLKIGNWKPADTEANIAKDKAARAAAAQFVRQRAGQAATEKKIVFKKPKEPRDMTASEINKRLDRLDAEGSKHTKAMIDAGRGHELPTETFKLSDPLAVKMKDNFERRSALYHEIERRYGPGAPNRLPTRR
jgi:hypothetical protein